MFLKLHPKPSYIFFSSTAKTEHCKCQNPNLYCKINLGIKEQYFTRSPKELKDVFIQSGYWSKFKCKTKLMNEKVGVCSINPYKRYSGWQRQAEK